MSGKSSKVAKTRYKVLNWREYNESLVRRGDVTLWFDEGVLAAWEHANAEAKVGRPFTYSDLASRVGPGDCSPRPLTEPDLWTSHPALQVVASNIKQSLLFDGDPLLGVQRMPPVGEHHQPRGEPGIGICLVDAGTDATSPEASTLIGGVCRQPRRNITRNQVAIKMPRTLLLANDDRPQPTPNMSVEFVERPQSIFGTQPKIPDPASQVAIQTSEAPLERTAPVSWR